MNQKYPVASPVKGWQQYLVQKRDVGFGAEVFLLVTVNKLRIIRPHCPKNLLSVALPFGRDLGTASQPRPSGVQGRGLSERGFIFEDDYRPFDLGFFLSLGYV